MKQFNWFACFLSIVMLIALSGCVGGDSEEPQSADSDGPKVQKKYR